MHDRGDAISEIETDDASGLQLNRVLEGRTELGSHVAPALTGLSEWAQQFQDAQDAAPPSLNSDDDYLGAVSDNLARVASGMERDLLRKSLEETLITASGVRSDAAPDELRAGLRRTIAREGVAELVRLFLSFHAFNLLWFRASESYRANAPTQQAFMERMFLLERTCQRIVQSACKPLDDSPLAGAASAQALIDKIESELKRL